MFAGVASASMGPASLWSAFATLYKQGQSAEDIVQTYPQLSLSQVYAALAYYHANRAEIEAALAAADAQYDELARQHTSRNSAR